jgi:hypothetical protein
MKNDQRDTVEGPALPSPAEAPPPALGMIEAVTGEQLAQRVEKDQDDLRNQILDPQELRLRLSDAWFAFRYGRD